MKTLIIFAHTDFDNSYFNKSLLDSIKDVSNVDIKHLSRGIIDNIDEKYVENEISFLSKYEKVIFQFPLFWYTFPFQFKVYLDDVLTQIIKKNNILKDKTFQIITTCGGTKDKYEVKVGSERELDKLLYPTNKIMQYVGMKILPPYGIYNCNPNNQNSSQWRGEVEKYKKLF